MSLPAIADVVVNCEPISCMPSPESPENRMVTCSATVTLEGQLFGIGRQIEYLPGKVLGQVIDDVLVPNTACYSANLIHHRDTPESTLLHEPDCLSDRIGPGDPLRVGRHPFGNGQVERSLVAEDTFYEVALGEYSGQLAIAGEKRATDVLVPHPVNNFAQRRFGIEYCRRVHCQRHDLNDLDTVFNRHMRCL